MADSITSLGASPIYFPLVPNWGQIPKISFGMSRDFVSYPGTANLMTSITDDVPDEFTLSFMVTDKDSEYELLDFIHTVRGRAYRFWMEYPLKQFELTTTSLSGSSLLVCQPNGFENIVQGYERIFFAMKNGDLIVRQAEEAVFDGVDELQITLDSPLDRDIAPDDYWIIGRFLLCRLNSDDVAQQPETRDISTFSLGFVELTYEYEEETA